MSKRFSIEDRKFFEVSAEKLAEWLIGKVLCHKITENGESFIIKCRINVTEAYKNEPFTDYNRQKNPTSQILSGGHIHYYCEKGEGRKRLDIVAGAEGSVGSVLIRGVDPYKEGPQVAVWALDAKEDCDGTYLLDENSNYWLEDDGAIVIPNEPTKRVNIESDELLRFSMKGFKHRDK